MKSVPNGFLGVWRRRLLTTSTGLHDDTSAVYWLQTARLHVDIRIPLAQPSVITLLEACSPEQMLALAGQEGFAGRTQVEGDICQWHRLFDYQPDSGRPDIGRVRFESADRLLEDGLDDSYQHIWERLPDSRGVNWGIWLQAADGSPRQACLVVAGDYFMFAAERPVPVGRGGHLRDRIPAASPAQRIALLSAELSFGRHLAGATPWLITHSSLPGRAGQVLMPEPCYALCADSISVESLARIGMYAPPAGWIRVADPLPAQQPLPMPL